MAANLGKLDDQVVRHLCRQMQDMTQVCEAMALKLLEVETRLDQMDSSLQGVAVAMESDGLHELLDAVGGRLGDLKGLLGVDGESVGVAEVEASSSEVLSEEQVEADADDSVVEDLDLHSPLNEESDAVVDPSETAEDLDTIYVDDPQMDLMSA